MTLRHTSPFRNWIGQQYMITETLYLYPHASGLAEGEADYRLYTHRPNDRSPLTVLDRGTEVTVSDVEVRRRLIDIPHLYIEVEVPLKDDKVLADVELYPPYPIRLDWPDSQ